MTALRLEQDVDFHGWRALRIVHGALTLHLLPQLGGRIMGIALDGTELAFVQPERAGTLPTAGERADLESWRGSLGFPLWGGGKTWLAPESAFPGGAPHPDLDSGPYCPQILTGGAERIAVRMDSKVCRDTGLRLTRTVELRADAPGWRVFQRAKNNGKAAWTGGLWDVLMLRRPAEVFWPAPRVSVFPDKADPAAGRRALRPGRVVCDRRAEFKLGGRLREGWMAARLGEAGYLRRFALPERAVHAHGWPAEVYNSGLYDYIEIESHGPQVTLQPGDSTEMTVHERVAPWPAIAACLKGEMQYEYNPA